MNGNVISQWADLFNAKCSLETKKILVRIISRNKKLKKEKQNERG
jgi:hypothetical protein